MLWTLIIYQPVFRVISKVLLRIALEVYGAVETEDQLAMLLNAHLPALLPLDECTLFRVEGDHLHDLHASIKRELGGIVGRVACAGTPFCSEAPERFGAGGWCLN